MSETTLAEVTNQVQKYWAPIFTRKLRETFRLAALVNKDYQGEIKKGGDTVRVSQITDPTGETRTIGTDADTYATEKVATTYVDVVANKRAVTAYEFADLVELQSQIDKQQVQDGMMFALDKQINTYLLSLVNPSTSAPDHLLNSVATIDKTQLAAIRQLAATAKWNEAMGWYGLIGTSYWSSMLIDSVLANMDYGVTDAPVVGGQKAMRRLGFNMFEDNSQTATAVFFHPDFLNFVIQQAVQVKISDLHAQKRFGFVMSVDVVFGAALGLQGNVKHIKVLTT